MPTPRLFSTIWLIASCRESSIVTFGRTFAAVKKFVDHPPRIPAAFAKDQFFAGKRRRADIFFLCQRMLRMSDRDDLVAEQQIASLHSRFSTGNETNAVSISPCIILSTSVWLVPELNREFRIRKCLRQLLHNAGQLLRREHRRRRTDPQAPVFGSGELGDLGKCRIVLAKYLSRACRADTRPPRSRSPAAACV